MSVRQSHCTATQNIGGLYDLSNLCTQIKHQNDPEAKVIYPKYSKHCPYTVAHTIDCFCSKMLNHGFTFQAFQTLNFICVNTDRNNFEDSY